MQYRCPQKKFFSWFYKKTPENWSTNVLKKIYLGRFRVLEFFSTTLNDQIFFSSRALKKYYISMNLCILIGYTRKHQKIGVPMSSKKYIWVGFGFSNFFRLLETTEFFFLPGLLKSKISAWTYVLSLVTQENTRKLANQCPQIKLFGSNSGSRIFFDFSKRPYFYLFQGS